MLHFSLEAFFLVSGYLAAITLISKGQRYYFRNRIATIALPVVTIAVLFNPVIHYLRYGFYNNISYGTYRLRQVLETSLSGRWDGYELHLWFLLILLVYAILLPNVSTQLSRVAHLLTRYRPLTLALGFALIYATYMVAILFVLDQIEAYRLLFPLLKYLPFFAAGVMGAYAPQIWESISTVRMPIVAIGLLGIGILYIYRGPGWGPAGIFGAGLLSATLVMVLLSLSKTHLDTSNRASELLSKTSYTIYLLHTAVMFLVLSLIDFYSGDVNGPLVIILTGLAILIPMLFHVHLIERSSLMKCLFLGKLPASQASWPTQNDVGKPEN